MTDPLTLSIIAFTFLLAGAVKGVIGLGLPLVSLAILTATIGLQEAMALFIVPATLTNIWQALVGGHARDVLRRIWPFLTLATACVWIGASAQTTIDISILTAILGLLLISYAVVNLNGIGFRLTAKQEVWAGPLAGVLNGVLTGMTGSGVMPGLLYLTALGLPRDALIQAMGMLFTVLTIALGFALHSHNLLTAELGALSSAALIPTVIGMILGQRYRRSLSELVFRRFFFVALFIMGAFIVVQAFTK